MGYLSDIIAPAADVYGARTQNSETRRESRLNRAFQERMSSTAHQREVADLRKAGLNPILSAKHGGASSPSGNVGQMVSTTKGAAESYNRTRQTSSAIKNLTADTVLKNTQADQAAALIEQANAQTKFIQTNAAGKAMQNDRDAILNQFLVSSNLDDLAKSLGVAVGTLTNWLAPKDKNIGSNFSMPSFDFLKSAPGTNEQRQLKRNRVRTKNRSKPSGSSSHLKQLRRNNRRRKNRSSKP